MTAVTALDDPVLLAVAVLDGDDDCRDALWVACGGEVAWTLPQGTPTTYSTTLVAAQRLRRNFVGHENAVSPDSAFVVEPLPGRREPTSPASSPSPLPTPRVELRRPVRPGCRAGLIDDLIVVVSTVVGAAWIVACAVALTRLTGG